MVPVEFDGPSELFELVDEPRVDEMDRALVDAGARLATAIQVAFRYVNASKSRVDDGLT